MILDIDGTITSPTHGNLIGKSLVYKNIFIDTLGLTIFLNVVSVTLIDKTDRSDP